MPYKNLEDRKECLKRFHLNNPEYGHNRGIRRRKELNEYQKEARKKYPDRYRNYELKRNFNITLSDYDLMLEKQDFKCAACGSEEAGGKYNRFMVDHDHNCCPDKRYTCGKCIRGLPCSRCNMVLGEVKDNIDILKKLIDYLNKRLINAN